MSKRFIFPQQNGGRKRAKLDISVSDHNFPLSQNIEPNKEATWGDDNDDEMLLLASQACEEAYSTNDISMLPNYSMCMQPSSTSTQIHFQPGPSTSKTEFTFKKPSNNTPSAISTHLKQKCSTISSPLPGISSKVIQQTNGQVNLSDDLIFNEQIYKGQDSDHIYRQLLQMQEENAKLKSENGKLLEKCVTKEGEASILRTQLKTCQVAVDNARLEKIKTQEKVQMEWTDKLTAANAMMTDLRTQLDFKNLEIISIKEKCKKLESTKVRLTQVNVPANDISSSHRHNNSSFTNDSQIAHSRRVKTTSSGVQTESRVHFLKLNNTISIEASNLNHILPHILEPTTEQQAILDYNDKLQKQTDFTHKCRVFSTFHRIPSTASPAREITEKATLNSLYEDLTCVATGNCEGNLHEKYLNIFTAIQSSLTDVQNQLEVISRRVTTAFQKEMDEKYIETSNMYLYVSKQDLLKGRALYKEEQSILARRMTAILAYIIECKGIELFSKFLDKCYETDQSDRQKKYVFIEKINRICNLLDSTSCAPLYSGLLLSIIILLEQLTNIQTVSKTHLLDIIKTIVSSRPMPFVACRLMRLLRGMSTWDEYLKAFCPKSVSGNLRLDYDQGVLLYKKDSCYIQVLLKQIEACLKCIESQNIRRAAVDTTRHLMVLYTNIYCDNSVEDKSRCECQLVLIQVIVYALRICAVMLQNTHTTLIDAQELVGVCRCGIQLVYRCSLREMELGSHLSHNEGHLIQFTHIMKDIPHPDVYANMLSELTGTLQSSPEEMPPSFHSQPWLRSFQTFTLTD